MANWAAIRADHASASVSRKRRWPAAGRASSAYPNPPARVGPGHRCGVRLRFPRDAEAYARPFPAPVHGADSRSHAGGVYEGDSLRGGTAHMAPKPAEGSSRAISGHMGVKAPPQPPRPGHAAARMRAFSKYPGTTAGTVGINVTARLSSPFWNRPWGSRRACGAWRQGCWPGPPRSSRHPAGR